MSKTHTLIITVTPGADPTEVDHWQEFAVDCPGVTDACRAWQECQVAGCPANAGNSNVLWEVSDVSHGQEHRHINDAWMTATDRCYLLDADELPDVAETLATKPELPPGRYEVVHSFDDGAIEYLELAAA